MARDRKRAKQRQRRRAQQQGRQAPPDGNGQGPGDEVVEDEIVHEDHEEDPAGAPDPLAHASADVDIAELAEASAHEPGAPEGPLEADEYPQPDELEGADALEPSRGKPSRGGAVKPGAELPREGNRFVNFLR